MMQWIVLPLLLITASPSLSECRQMSAQNVLLKELLDGYGFQSTRPVYNLSHVTTVVFGLTLIQVIELSERYQTLEVGVWLTQQWLDEYLTWDPKDYNGVDHLYIEKSKIWLPDTTLYKNVDTNFESYKDIPVIVNSDGSVFWSTPAILKTACRINAGMFPFDTQVCQLKFSSWAYGDNQLNLTKSEEAELVEYSDVGVWELLKVVNLRGSKSYEGSVVYTELSYFIHLQRRPLFFLLQIVLPCVLLSLLNLMVFVLPPESGEKISLGMTNLLSLVLFQQQIGTFLPPASENTPIIGFYFTSMIILSCFSIIITVVVLNIYFRDNRRPIPRSIKYLTFRVLGKLVKYPTPEGTLDAEPAGENCRNNGSLDSGLETSTHSDFLPSDIHLYRVDDWVENHNIHPDTLQIAQKREYASTNRSKTISSPVGRAKRHAEIKGHRSAREGHQASDDRAFNGPVWRDVALVIDRAALLISTLVTLTSFCVTILCYFLNLNKVD
ncbi:neuronal acetylcholine receptor subunit beta-3-like [Asterias rubens]|uniref:neuronal acetylcholine receptor subunit beta-3-like n=1 Tax=Asterias rubens TaxID=7604 RepID=UPI0014550B3B|nr:neuronal acetylcholine receptor subunit beta-3-like [Asterias rubens]